MIKRKLIPSNITIPMPPNVNIDKVQGEIKKKLEGLYPGITVSFNITKIK